MSEEQNIDQTSISENREKIKSALEKNLKRTFRGRVEVEEIDQHREKSAKMGGASSGWVAQHNDKTTIFKPINSEQQEIDKRDNVVEQVFAGVAHYLHGKNSAHNMVTKTKHDGKHQVASEFLDNFQELAHFNSENDIHLVNPFESPGKFEQQKNIFDNIEGLEKSFVSSLFIGDCDSHNGNLGVTKNEAGELNFARIDFGRAGIYNFDDLLDRSLLQDANTPGYNHYNYLDPKKLEAAAKYSAESVNEEVLDQLLLPRFDALKKQGIDISDINFFYSKNPEGVKFDRILPDPNNPNDPNLFSHVKNLLMENHKQVQNFAEKMEIVNKINFPNEMPHKNHHIIKMLPNILKPDPILYAVHYNLPIEGKPAMEYAQSNNIKIDGLDPYLAAIKYDSYIEGKPAAEWALSQRKFNNRDEVVNFAYENKANINGLHPLIHQALSNRNPAKINERLDGLGNNIVEVKQGKKMLMDAAVQGVPIQGQDAVIFAHENDVKLANTPAIKWAFDNNVNINNENPFLFAMRQDINIENKPAAVWLEESNMVQIQSSSPIEFAIELDYKIGGKSAPKFLLENNSKINKEPALQRLERDNKKIDGKSPIDYAIKEKIVVAPDVVADIAKSPDVSDAKKEKLNNHFFDQIRNNKIDIKNENTLGAIHKILEKNPHAHKLLNKLHKDQVVGLIENKNDKDLGALIKGVVENKQRKFLFFKNKYRKVLDKVNHNQKQKIPLYEEKGDSSSLYTAPVSEVQANTSSKSLGPEDVELSLGSQSQASKIVQTLSQSASGIGNKIKSPASVSSTRGNKKDSSRSP